MLRLLVLSASLVASAEAAPSNRAPYPGIPANIAKLLATHYPDNPVPTASARSAFGDAAFFAGMLEGADPGTSYAASADFNGDRRRDHAVILLPSSPGSRESRLVIVLSTGARGFSLIEPGFHVGLDYALSVERAGPLSTAAGKGFAADASEPKQVFLNHPGLRVQKMASAGSVLWWNGGHFERTFISD